MATPIGSFPCKIKSLISSFLHSGNVKEKQEDDRTDACHTNTNGTSSKDDSFNKSLEHSSSVDPPSKARDKDAFYKRVESFSAFTWVAKPDSLSPLQCARYGWENCDTDMLRCRVCHAKLFGQLPKSYDIDSYHEACDKLKSSLLSAHQPFCPWVANQCPEHFLHIPSSSREDAITEFMSRYASLREVGENLPQLADMENKGITSTVKEKLCNLIEEQCRSCNSESLVASTSAVLAVCGWTKSSSKNNDVIMCKNCCRQVGLWTYLSIRKSKETSENPDSPSETNAADVGSDEEPTQKKRKMENNELFDPLNGHRSWCPWITSKGNSRSPSNGHGAGENINNSLSESNGSATADDSNNTLGWMYILHVILPKMSPKKSTIPFDKKSPLHEGLRTIRQTLNAWSSPKS